MAVSVFNRTMDSSFRAATRCSPVAVAVSASNRCQRCPAIAQDCRYDKYANDGQHLQRLPSFQTLLLLLFVKAVSGFGTFFCEGYPKIPGAWTASGARLPGAGGLVCSQRSRVLLFLIPRIAKMDFDGPLNGLFDKLFRYFDIGLRRVWSALAAHEISCSRDWFS